MREPFIFMIIFGAVILIAAGIIAASKDPRDSFLLSKMHYKKNMPLKEAQKHAKLIAKIIALVSLGPIIGGMIGLFIGDIAWIVILVGSIFLLIIGVKLFTEENDPPKKKPEIK